MRELSATLAPIDLLEAPDKLAKFTRNLPESDGEPMENEREWLEISLILDSLYECWQGRTDFFAGGNMFLYYHLAQAKQIVAEMKGKAQRHAFRGPDVFVVLNVDGSYRRQKWVVWEEVIFEFFSPSTQRADRTTKKELYEQTFQTPEYYWYDPFNPALFQGWQLDEDGHYQEMAHDQRGWIWSPALQLWIGRIRKGSWC
jgi:Uma2 family endonuclease